MAVATPISPAGQIAQALVDFSVEGAFPEESVSSLTVDSDALPAAIEALASAKAKLQVPTVTSRATPVNPLLRLCACL